MNDGTDEHSVPGGTDRDTQEWVLYLALSSALVILGLLSFDDAAWYVQYGTLGAAVLLSGVAVVRAAGDDD
ncbi:hypothetical protein [Halorubellus sp. PRR65]|uniref:hypothetical protein n=1 Tax=Halorubellus sp. PRR65 TaxID=3098148 RepID=UPI002B26436C|nr:hypothetical protein [Halorubellus sp. PRR65]